MKYTYAYKTSDGKRHEAAMEAASREAVFEALRGMGIKAIKVVAEDGSKANGEEERRGGGRGATALPGRRSLMAAGVGVLLIAIAAVAWWLGRRRPPAEFTVDTPQGRVTYTIAAPLPRQMIPGDRTRIEEAAAAFRHGAEAFLARYAEPGRKAEGANGRDARSPSGGALGITRPTRDVPSKEEFEAALKEPIRTASTDFTEAMDLKRIVAGMKAEMQAYIAGGGTAEGYVAELEKRQKLEMSYRENAERRLEEMLEGDSRRVRDNAPYQAARRRDGGVPSHGRDPIPQSHNLTISQSHNPTIPQSNNPTIRQGSSYREAYAYWLKANAQLQSMGIYPLPLPDVLRAYQMNMDIDRD